MDETLEVIDMSEPTPTGVRRLAIRAAATMLSEIGWRMRNAAEAVEHRGARLWTAIEAPLTAEERARLMNLARWNGSQTSGA